MSDKDFKLHRLKVNIKQHTPMIHFQHEQGNATIRMTELKPKLDKFIYKKCFQSSGNSDYYKYLVGYNGKTAEDKYKDSNFTAFDYRVRVQNIKKPIDPKDINRKDFPLYFGNMGKTDNNKKFTYCDNLDLIFTSKHEEILEKIISVLPEFFMKTNFGTRQSKGFGSFFISNNNVYYLDGRQCKFKDVDKVKKLTYQFSVKKNRNSDKFENFKKVFMEIDTFYNSLRRGLNGNKIDPFIKEYSSSKGIRWDKDEIKDKLSRNKNTNSDLEPRLMKDLFGLSVSENWRMQNTTITKKHSNNNIERFQSPIFFKILDEGDKFIVHFEARKIPEEYLGEEFEINIINKNNKNDKKTLRLKTPEEFDFDEFFKYVLNKKTYPGKVRQIFEDIKSNMKG